MDQSSQGHLQLWVPLDRGPSRIAHLTQTAAAVCAQRWSWVRWWRCSAASGATGASTCLRRSLASCVMVRLTTERLAAMPWTAFAGIMPCEPRRARRGPRGQRLCDFCGAAYAGNDFRHPGALEIAGASRRCEGGRACPRFYGRRRREVHFEQGYWIDSYLAAQWEAEDAGRSSSLDRGLRIASGSGVPPLPPAPRTERPPACPVLAPPAEPGAPSATFKPPPTAKQLEMGEPKPPPTAKQMAAYEAKRAGLALAAPPPQDRGAGSLSAYQRPGYKAPPPFGLGPVEGGPSLSKRPPSGIADSSATHSLHVPALRGMCKESGPSVFKAAGPSLSQAAEQSDLGPPVASSDEETIALPFALMAPPPIDGSGDVEPTAAEGPKGPSLSQAATQSDLDPSVASSDEETIALPVAIIAPPPIEGSGDVEPQH